MSDTPWLPPSGNERIVVDHALLGTLNEGSEASDWDAALQRMGVPALLVGSEWPEPVRVLTRERLAPDRMDRWMLARIGATLGTGALMLALFLLLLVAFADWGRVGFSIGGVCCRVAIVPIVILGIMGLPAVAPSAIATLGPRGATSQKTRNLADAATALRKLDFVARFDGLTVHNDPSGAWLGAIGQVAERMLADIDRPGGDPVLTAELATGLREILPRIAEAAARRATVIEAAVARTRLKDGLEVLPLDFDVAALDRVDALASKVEPYRRWLPPFPRPPGSG